MTFEVVEFYPNTIEKDYIQGSVHVYWIEENLDIRGVYYRKKLGKDRVCMPHMIGKNPDTGKQVRYPVLNFLEPEKNKLILKAVKKAVKEYMNEQGLK